MDPMKLLVSGLSQLQLETAFALRFLAQQSAVERWALALKMWTILLACLCYNAWNT